MEKETLIQQAYTLFPKGLNDDDRNVYENTKEFMHLRQVLNESREMDTSWNLLLQSLSKDGFKLEEIGFQEKPPRVYRIAVRKNGMTSPKVVINISRIIPFFSVYALEETYDLKEFRYPVLFENFSENDIPVIAKIMETISYHFKGFKLFPVDFINVEVKDIQYGELGMVDQNPYGIDYNPMTLFNVYFSNFIFF